MYFKKHIGDKFTITTEPKKFSEVEPKFFWSNMGVNFNSNFLRKPKIGIKNISDTNFKIIPKPQKFPKLSRSFLKQNGCQFQLKFPQETKNRHKKYIGDKIYDHSRTHKNFRSRAEVLLKQYKCQFKLKFLQEAKNRHTKYIGDKI